MWFSPHHFPTPQYFLHSIHLRNCFLPLISSHMEEKQLLMYHFEEFKGKKTSFVREWLRQIKDLEKLCKIFES